MIFFTALIALLTSSTDAFHHPFIRSSLHKYDASVHKFTATVVYSSDDDDWYADYDPSKFEHKYNDDDGFNDSRSMNRRSGGGERSGRRAGYTRDTSRDLSNIDENAVVGLLNQRTEAKKIGDFDTADAIRDKLLNEYAVGVNDREKTWRTGCSASGSGQRFGGGGRNARGRGGGEGRRDRDSKPRKPRDFGPRGHDYSLSEDAGANASQLSEDEIHNLLAERLQAKMNRNFQLADSLQMELIDAGVFVHDGMKEWRADGVPYGSFQNGRGPGRTAGSRNDQTSNYTKSPYSADVIGASESVVDALVQERLKFKMNRDFDKADAIREGLRTKFNVLIDDRLKEWSVGGDFGEEHNKQRELADIFSNRGYIKSSASLSLSPEDEQYIQEKVDERCQAKKDRDFSKADEIRQLLEDSFDVSINDKLKLWSVGGAFDELGGTKQKARGVYKRRGGGEVSDEDVLFIEKMLKKRYDAKRLRDFDVADEIRDMLMSKYGVKIDDRSNEWRVETDDYALIGSHDLSAEDISYIESKLKERFAFKLDRYYDEADSIRNELQERFGVVVDDRTKEWRVEDMSLNKMRYEITTQDVIKEPDDFLQTDQNGDLSVDDYSSIDNQDGEESIGDNEHEILKDSENNMATLSKLTVPQLKEKLKESGLPVSGKKAELIERLLAL